MFFKKITCKLYNLLVYYWNLNKYENNHANHEFLIYNLCCLRQLVYAVSK